MDEDAKELIRKAFEMARRSGKPDWHRMTTAVLKNRLLTLTNREFATPKYGAATFREFLENANDVVSVDYTTSPETVELLDRSRSEETPSTGGLSPIGTRVRPDLWLAAVDYSSNRRFVWDVDQQRARPQSPGEANELVLPTVSPADLSSWRGEFVTKHSPGADDATAAKLDVWEKQRLPSALLPGPLRGEWNQELKARIEKRLRHWFSEKGLPPPHDLRMTGSVSGPAGVGVEAIRNLVMDCVAVMNERELTDLRLPPSVVQRMLQRRARK